MRLFACANPSRSISRRQWLYAASGRRSFQLLAATFPPDDVQPLAPSRREILDFTPVDFYPSASRTHVNLQLFTSPKPRPMSLETALAKFSKVGKLLVPLPQRRTHKADEPLRHRFKPIDASSLKVDMGLRGKHLLKDHEYHFYPNSRKDTSLFEACMVEIFLLVSRGGRVEIQVHREGPRDEEGFKRMLKRNIHLRPDVILAAMPSPSRIIIHPCTNYEKVCWVMEGPVINPYTREVEAPSRRVADFERRRLEVLEGVSQREGERLQAGEEQAAFSSVIGGNGAQIVEQEQPQLLSENGGMLDNHQEIGDARAGHEREGLRGHGDMPSAPEKTLPSSTPPPHLTLEEQEMEDYKEIEELTGFR